MVLRSRRLRALALPPLLAGTVPALAQTAPATPVPAVAVDTTPWLYKGSDIEQDPAWRFGTLPNGLRYAVRKNGVPPGQVAIRVRVDAGSLMETDAERGYAHFIEHLTFRGSAYVPDGEAKRTWQRFGATFGTDQNAQTTPTQTVYHLDLPNATEGTLDASLKILSGMMAAPNIVPAALDAERPVVLAEQREQPAPQVRFSDAQNALFFAGQPLADRAPIGTVKSLDAATAAAVKAFHDRWYRPERTTVVVDGDMDEATLARLVVKNFAAWRAIGLQPAAPDLGRPDPRQPPVATNVEPTLPPVVATAVLRPWTVRDDTVIFNQKRLVDELAVEVINRRLEERARASGASFLQASVSLEDVARSANVTAANIVPVGGNWQAALRDVRAVIADAQAAPPTQAEIDREVAEQEQGYATAVATAEVEAASLQADTLVQAVDIHETTTTPQVERRVFEDAKAKGMFTPAAVLASTRRIFQGDATRAIINLPKPDPTVAPRLAAALTAPVKAIAGRRRATAAVDFSRLPPLGPAGTVASREQVPGFHMERVTFSNGARLLLFADPGNASRVFVRVRWGGGYGALPADRRSPVWAGGAALAQSGVGKLTEDDLEVMTTGRRMGLEFGIDDDAFSWSAMTSTTDLPDQLRLFAAKLHTPGWDPAPVSRAKQVLLTTYPGLDASPDGVLSRDLEGLLHDGDPRWGTPTPAQVQATTPAAFRALWAPVLASGPIEVDVFGDVKADDAIAAVAKSIGALPTRAVAVPPAPAERFPAHVATPVVRTHEGAENQAAAVIAWPTGGGVDGIGDSRRLDVLAAVFSDRLFEKLRQADGASYSPDVQSQWPVGAASGGRLIATGKVTPDKVDFFFATARAIAADLVAHPIGPDELKRIMLPMAEYLQRAATSDLFWMGQVSGGAYDPRRIAAARSLASDFGSITPEQLQAVAAKYLRPERDWTMEVLPRSVAAKRGAGQVAAR